MFISDKEILEKFGTKYRVWQGIPSIERTLGGRLFSTFYSGTSGEGLGNFCVLVKSDDDGKTWSEPIGAAFEGDAHRCFDPTLWIDPLGKLWFFWCLGPEFETYAAVCDNPDADELVWREDIFIGYGVMLNKPTVLSGGEWLFPLCVWDYWAFFSLTWSHTKLLEEYFEKENFKNSGANVHISTDNGKTITFLGCSSSIEGRSYDESMIYEKQNGVIVMLTRTLYGIATCESYDGGKTWTDGRRGNITGPSSRFHIKRLKSGRLLMINHYKYTGRNNLTAMLSEDDGNTWPYTLMLDSRNNVSYPDAAEGEDGWIYITYDRDRGCSEMCLADAQKCAREILLAKIHEEDIIAGEIKNPESFTQRIVSKLGEYIGTADYFGGLERRDAQQLADEILRYDNPEDIIASVFGFYPISCQKIQSVDIRKMDKLIENIKTNNGSRRENLVSLINLLNSTELSVRVPQDEPIVNRTIDYIREHLAEDIDVSKLAQQSNISVYYLCHLFKKCTKLSIFEYRNACRFLKAKRLLAKTDMKVSEIALQCGFSSYSFFTKKFREQEKLSPSQYRSLHR